MWIARGQQLNRLRRRVRASPRPVGQVHGDDQRIDQGTQSGIQAQKPGLQQDLRYAQQDRDRAQSDNYDAQRDKTNAATQLSSAQGQYNSARQEADQNQGRVNKLNTAIRDLSNQKDNLQAEHHQADNTRRDLQSKLDQCRNS